MNRGRPAAGRSAPGGNLSPLRAQKCNTAVVEPRRGGLRSGHPEGGRSKRGAAGLWADSDPPNRVRTSDEDLLEI